jgi:hypothetical protein
VDRQSGIAAPFDGPASPTDVQGAVISDAAKERVVFPMLAGWAERSAGTLLLFITGLFTSALLLFLVQPMIARMLLPLLGGTPTVWNTCMVFFQAVLLAGYAYSHLLTRHFSVRAQVLIHSGLLLITLLALPMALSESAARSVPWQSNPMFWLLKTLLIVVGLPFFIVSTSGPLLQNWFSRTDHPSARDPYFLYAASNLGSLIALIGYPAFVEPALRLQQQSMFWAALYGAFLILFACCGVNVWKKRSSTTSGESISHRVHSTSLAIPFQRRIRWILIAFVPSSLMLGVTTYLTTDIASIPLLWVIPLSLYLLTFILAFARKTVLPLPVLSKVLPGVAIALVFLLLTDVKNPAWLLIGLHLLFFFVAALICHSRLANDRPSSHQLTDFYLCLSIGGVLGGLFNGLLAPILFRTVLEYPLVIVIACAMRSAPEESQSAVRPRWLDWVLSASPGIATALLAFFLPRLAPMPHQLSVLIIFGLPLLAAYLLSKRSVRFGLALGAIMIGAQFHTAVHGRTLHVERNFFGALRVTLDPDGQMRRFYHGTTVHGIQFVDQARRREPLAYYHRTGPFGLAYAAFESQPANHRVAAIGLGAGAMACYATPGQEWTFYEIDPAVLGVAKNTNFFSYLEPSPGVAMDYKLGDARLRLREAPASQYGLIICDAFSSDVPPLHLITKEAMELYLSKLAPGGRLVFNISSRYLDFRPVLGNLAANFQLSCLDYDEAGVGSIERKDGKYPSHWVVMSRQREELGSLLTDWRWQVVGPSPEMGLWTDDYSNILAIFNWK